VLDLTAPESRDLVMHTIAAGGEHPYECIGFNRSADRFYMELVDKACRFEGRPARAIAVRDITSRRQSEEQRSRMAAIVDASSEAIVGSTEEGIVTHWNRGAERIFGFSAAEMVGRHISAIVPPEGALDFSQIGQRLGRDERIQNYETVRLRNDGTRIEVSLSISPVRDRLGRLVGVAMVAHDNTERKLAAAALQESETRYRRLVDLGNMSPGRSRKIARAPRGQGVRADGI
jgi:PAS domain S-box-containing protein